MKKLLYSTAFLLTTASLQAMDDVRIVPFDSERHSADIKRIFQEALPYFIDSAEEIINPDRTIHSNFVILEHERKTIGFARYNLKKLPKNHLFYGVRKSNVQMKICELDYMAIDHSQRGNGFGAKLMKHVEERARKHNDDMIMLSSVNNSQRFYEKHKFMQIKPPSNQMAKPLNKKSHGILHRVIKDRLKKSTH